MIPQRYDTIDRYGMHDHQRLLPACVRCGIFVRVWKLRYGPTVSDMVRARMEDP